MRQPFNAAPRRTCLWIILLFIILPCLAFPEIIFGQQTLYWTDLTWIHYPRHIFAAEEWLAGRVPLWDPYENTGIPLLAEAQVGVLYPFSAIFLSPFSPSLELSLFILIHFTLAALFTFILVRSLGLGRTAATVAGLAYGCGGFLMTQTPNLNIMSGAVWLPLVLYGVRQVLQRRDWLTAMLAGIPLALQILTAQPQTVFYTLVIIAGYAVYHTTPELLAGDNASSRSVIGSGSRARPRAMKNRRPILRLFDNTSLFERSWSNSQRALRSGLLLILAVGVGLLLAAPQLLPTFELQQLSVRAVERDFSFLTKNSLPPIMLLNLLLPSAFGNNLTGFKGGDPFQEVFVYVGFIPLLLAGFSWGQRHKQDALFFYFLLSGALLLALGRYTPLYAFVIQYLPGFALFRIPSRWLMGLNLALAVLAAFGLENLRERRISRRALTAVLVINLTLFISLLLIWRWRAMLPLWGETYLSEFHQRLIAALVNKAFVLDPVYGADLLFGGLLGLRVPAVLLVVNIITASGLLILLATKRVTYHVFAQLVVIAVTLDLLAAGGTTINPTKPGDWWHHLSGGAAYALDNVGEARVFPLGMGSEEATVSHLGQYFPSVYRVRSAGGHGSSLLNARYKTFLDKADPVQAMQVVGARYLLTLGQMGADVAATYPVAYSDQNSFVYENKNPLPRAFIVHQAIPVNDPAGALARLQGRSFDPAQTVVIETETASSIVMPLTTPPAAHSRATITNQHAQLVEVETASSHDGYLVLLDTYYPGWVATVDGRPTPIYAANYIGRAVFMPAGEHTARFEYRPRSFRWGVGLALLAVIGIGGTAFVEMRGRKGHHPSRLPQIKCINWLQVVGRFDSPPK